MGEETALLDDVSHPPAHRDAIPFGGGLTLKPDFPRGARGDPVHALEQGGFSRSAAPQQYYRFPFFDRQIDVAQHLASANAARQGANFNDWGHGAFSRPLSTAVLPVPDRSERAASSLLS